MLLEPEPPEPEPDPELELELELELTGDEHPNKQRPAKAAKKENCFRCFRIFILLSYKRGIGLTSRLPAIFLL